MKCVTTCCIRKQYIVMGEAWRDDLYCSQKIPVGEEAAAVESRKLRVKGDRRLE